MALGWPPDDNGLARGGGVRRTAGVFCRRRCDHHGGDYVCQILAARPQIVYLLLAPAARARPRLPHQPYTHKGFKSVQRIHLVSTQTGKGLLGGVSNIFKHILGFSHIAFTTASHRADFIKGRN